jgi:hypothetical protein
VEGLVFLGPVFLVPVSNKALLSSVQIQPLHLSQGKNALLVMTHNGMKGKDKGNLSWSILSKYGRREGRKL